MSTEEDTKWLQWVTHQFETIAGEDREIDLQEFKAALNVKESFFAERFFTLFDSDGSGTITLQELLEALTLLIHGNPMDKLKFLFQVYDVDGSGSIDVDELRTVLQSCMRESAISLPDEKLDQLTLALFESADKDCNGAITFDELRDELQRFPGVMENLTISAAHWLTPPAAQPRRRRPRLLTSAYWHNHRSHLLCLTAYTVLHVLLFALAASAHRARGPSVMVAKGCGQCLNFDCSFIAVLMLRRCLTWLRATWLAQVLPLDRNIQFHQLMGYVVVVLSLVHTVAHVVNFALQAQSEDSPFRFWELLLTTRPGIGWVYGSASPTGVALLLLLVLMFACSSSCIRRSGHFEVFYWTHLSYFPMWILLILHGPNFWKWLLVPGILFFLEKIIGLAISHMGAFCIVEVNLLPSKVTHLLIERPPLFHYRPGDYLYLNVPSIARYEWHPFTISSAPEQKDIIWLHVRSEGQWTNRLYESFKMLCPMDCGSGQLSKSLKRRRSQRRPQSLPSQPMHSGTSAQGAVAFSRDVTVELTSYRPKGTPQQGDQGVVGTGTEEGAPAQRGAPAHLGPVSEMSSENHLLCNIKCYISGPYGTPTRRIFASEHAVLIGAGIGITPFASILQSIMYRHQKRKHICPSCQHSWMDSIQDEDMKLRKVDFIWINRDQRSFEWFVSLLTKLEMDQAEMTQEDPFLELHMYMTSALGKNDMKAIGLQMALDLLAKKEKKDSITGLQTRTQPGRPDWNKVFQKVAAEKKGKVQVFFCGSPALAKVLKGHCEQFSFKFFQENF
ncbi:NADPH oxidase 5 isoform X1 [Mustela lutreola]|uniref:NADPH oxidase 5 isoform X1 n=1 Tax=Mustela lutreola TaxID=9666 RepID=UPI00279780CF|nr:NADPH oxidase 5 isoform X1 [Mustela lutreola]XP_059036918.1 NADPH oxidase 5 isoform X1 [Mustela lutreola]